MSRGSSSGGGWPSTRMSLIDACAHPSRAGAREALETLIRAYRKCLYKYVRRHEKQPADAEDILQHFLMNLLSGKFFAGYRKESGRWRDYLRGCLKKEILQFRRSRRRRVDAGALPFISAEDSSECEVQIADTRGRDPEAQFDRDWAQDLLENSIRAVEGRLTDPLDLRVWKDCVLPNRGDRLDAAALAREMSGGATVTEEMVWTRASRLRKRLRRELIFRVRAQCNNAEDEKAVLDELLSALAPSPKKGKAGNDGDSRDK